MNFPTTANESARLEAAPLPVTARQSQVVQGGTDVELAAGSRHPCANGITARDRRCVTSRLVEAPHAALASSRPIASALIACEQARVTRWPPRATSALPLGGIGS